MDLFSLPRCRMDTCETKTSETFAPLGRFNDFSSLVSLSAKVPALQFTRSAWVHIDMSKVPTIQQSPLQQILRSPGLTLNLLKPKSFLGISASTSRRVVSSVNLPRLGRFEAAPFIEAPRAAKHQENDTPVKASHLLLVIAVCQVLVPEHCLLGEPPKHEKFVSFHKSSVEW